MIIAKIDAADSENGFRNKMILQPFGLTNPFRQRWS